MKNETILKKAVEKAVKNGFKWQSIWSAIPEDIEYTLLHDFEDIWFDNERHSMTSGKNNGWSMSYYRLIFSHSFAKAFWGEEYDWLPSYKQMVKGAKSKKNFVKMAKETGLLKAWQFHLSKMVLEKNPLDYLRRFLTK